MVRSTAVWLPGNPSIARNNGFISGLRASVFSAASEPGSYSFRPSIQFHNLRKVKKKHRKFDDLVGKNKNWALANSSVQT